MFGRNPPSRHPPARSPESQAPAPRTVTPRAPLFVDVEHDGHPFRVVVRRVAVARRFTLRVRSARRDIVLTMPASASAKAATIFAQKHAGWIADRLSRLDPPVPFEPGAEIPLRGRLHRLERRAELRRRVWLEPEGNDAPARLCVSGTENRFAADIYAFLRKEAAGDLARSVTVYATAVKRSVKGITLRDTRSRWGSCSSRGTLNFSWRLILAPPFVLDYLAAHEVAHLVHMDHSDAFWALTHRLAAHTLEAEAWLKANGARLHRFGPQASAFQPDGDRFAEAAAVRTKAR